MAQTKAQLISGASSQSVTFNDVTASTLNGLAYPTSGSLSGRNRIINGDMRIDQRNAGASVANINGYGIDRWVCYNIANSFSLQRSTVAPAGFTNSVLITTTTSATPAASDYRFLSQLVEGFNVADLAYGTANAVTTTLSFWVRSSLTGTFSGAFRNSGENRSYPFTYTINAANTFEYKTITIPGDTGGTWVTDNGVGLRVMFDLGSGSSRRGTAGSWSNSNVDGATGAVSLVGTNGATFYITGVQLEAGSVSTPFERRSYGQELALCQRYFCKTYNIADATGTNTPNGWIGQQNGSNGASYLTWFFPVRMRAAPTITYQANGTGSLWYDSAGGYIMTPSTVRIGEGQVLILVTGGNINTECSGHAFASIEL